MLFYFSRQRNISIFQPPNKNNIKKLISEYDIVIGSGITPALFNQLRLKLDVFYPYSMGIEFVDEHEMQFFLKHTNFFRKKRGDYLFVSEQNKKILGFVLILKKKNHFIIDLIATCKNFRKKGVATSLINFTNNQLMGKKDKIIAGTQNNNFVAVKMYQNLGFIRKKEKTFCYHIHGR